MISVTTRVAEGLVNDEADTGNYPIACRLEAFEPIERARHAALLETLRADIVEVRELEDGFAFRLSSPSALTTIAEWMPLERRCCPFLSFEIRWQEGDPGPWLAVMGGEGVKALVGSEFAPRPEQQRAR